MRPLKINFAAPRKMPATVWYAVAVVFASIALQQGMAAWKQYEQLQALESSIATLRAKQAEQERIQQEAATKAAIPKPYAKDAAEIAAVAAFPIERVFAAIESVQIVGVKLTSLDVSPTEGTARIEIEFSEPTALLKYVTALNAGDEGKWRLLQTRAGVVGQRSIATTRSGVAVTGFVRGSAKPTSGC